MAVLYTPHYAYFTDDNGDPLAGGLLYTYDAGTTTPKATYTTAAGDVAQTNPVVLDAYGRAVLFLDGAYKFVLKDSEGNAITNGTTDNVTAFATDLDVTNAVEITAVSNDKVLLLDTSNSDALSYDDALAISSLFSLADNSVTQAKMADDAIGLAELDAGTADRLLGFDGSGDPSEITIGTGLTLSAASLSVSSLSVSQGDLNTSTGAVSTNSITAVNLTLPGGTYGFWPQLKTSSASRRIQADLSSNSTSPYLASTTYVSNIALATPAGSDGTVYAQQRYVASSPPFDMGDGEVGGFIFAMINSAGAVVSSYAADVPPWAYNGPTDIQGKYDPVRKKKFQLVPRKLTTEEILDGAPIDMIEQEVTQEIKNADMGLIPHPFGGVPAGHTVVMLDPMSDIIKNIIDAQNKYKEFDVVDVIENYLTIDNSALVRKGPQGVMQVGISKTKKGK